MLGDDKQNTGLDAASALIAEQALKARIIKANTLLQAKVGLGPLDDKVLSRCQDIMENNKVDFAPLAREYLASLSDAIKQTREGHYDRNMAVEALTNPVMQLKAHASMFRYTLVGNLANIMLGFLESIEHMDDDAIDIVEAHLKTLRALVSKNLVGSGGSSGDALKSELSEAIRRYRLKRK